jgi:hypothetical protein
MNVFSVTRTKAPRRELQTRPLAGTPPAAVHPGPVEPALSTRADAVMSNPDIISVDPRSHAGQQQVATDATDWGAAAKAHSNGSANGQRRPAGSHSGTTREKRWTMHDVAFGRVRSARTDDPVTTVAAIMRDEAMDMVPVINRDGSVVGIVTTTDIIDLLAGYDPRQRQH